jgi:aldehyde dehydrogenase (NAD+)
MITLEIDQIIQKQDDYFQTGVTKNLQFRLEQLRTLKNAINKYEDAIIEACAKDMGKPEQEAYQGEIVLSISHIKFMQKNLLKFMRPQKQKLPLGHYPGKAFTIAEPYGRILIISPWNYPFQLAIVPLVGAMSAGNCAVIKPSEVSANVSDVIKQIIEESFDPQYITVLNGGPDIGQKLLAHKWDFIFFTGSGKVGKQVMQAASNHLTPVVLELGEKNPCIVDKDVNLKVAVKRIIHGKYFNNGQSCVAPDYLLVHSRIKDEFINLVDKSLTEFFGDYNKPNKDLTNIINHYQFDRLLNLMKDKKILLGGAHDKNNKFIAPTLIEVNDWNDKIMQNEIFGPLFPIMTYDNLDLMLEKLTELPKCLSLFLYTKNKEIQEKVQKKTSSGALVINESLIHFIMVDLPFGGVGESGIGKYHGQASFEAFSHRKSVLKKSLLFDVKQRFAPYSLSRKQAAWLFKFFSG